MDEIWEYDNWPTGEPYDWGQAARGGKWDSIDFHLDLGCGKLKKGRIGVDRFAADGVNIIADLDALYFEDGIWKRGPMTYGCPVTPGGDAVSLGKDAMIGLPFADNSIESIISYHALEHIGEGFIPLVDEVYRILKPDGIFRAITPLFPSRTAVEDPDHKRYIMTGTWESFCGTPGDDPNSCWLASFMVPYTQARFHMEDKDYTPPVPIGEQWTDIDAREIRVALRAMKETA